MKNLYIHLKNLFHRMSYLEKGLWGVVAVVGIGVSAYAWQNYVYQHTQTIAVDRKFEFPNDMNPASNSDGSQNVRGTEFDYGQFREELLSQLSFEATKPSECKHIESGEEDLIAFSEHSIDEEFFNKYKVTRNVIDSLSRHQIHTYQPYFVSSPFQKPRYFKVVNGNCTFIKAPLIASTNELPKDTEFKVQYHRYKETMYVEFVSKNYDNDQLVFEMELEGVLKSGDILDYTNYNTIHSAFVTPNLVAINELYFLEVVLPVNTYNAYFYLVDLESASLKLMEIPNFVNSFVTDFYSTGHDLYLLVASVPSDRVTSCYGKFGSFADCSTTVVRYNYERNEFVSLFTATTSPKFSFVDVNSNQFGFNYSFCHYDYCSQSYILIQNGRTVLDLREESDEQVDNVKQSTYEYKIGTVEKYKMYKQVLEQQRSENHPTGFNVKCWRNGSFCEVTFE